MTRARSLWSALALGWGALTLAGCGGGDNMVLVPRAPPDEFAVVQKAPLVVPPDFGLRPPGAAVARLPEPEANGPPPPAAQLTLGEAAVLGAAGVGEADAGIRARLSLEFERVVDGGRSFAERILFWQQPPQASETIDPIAEAERLRAEGLPVPPAGLVQPPARRTGSAF